MPGNTRPARARLVALAVAAAAVLILVPVVVRVIRHSDAGSTASLVANTVPPAAPGGPLPAALRSQWHDASAKAAMQGGTVVIADGSGVSGRDVVTGVQRWSYHRGNARLCDWTVQDSVVVAVFGKSHSCRDVTALDAGTGRRRWYRSADLGATVDISSAAGVVVARSGDQLLAVDTATGLNRWTASKPGCQYGPVAVGGVGAVAVLRCGTRTQVVSHDPYADNQRWSAPAPGADPMVVAATDQDVAVLSGAANRRLTLYDNAGHRVATVTDRRLSGPVPAAKPNGIAASGLLLFWTGQQMVAVDPGISAVRWAVTAQGPPTLEGARVLFAAAGSAVECASATGRVVRRIAVDGDLPIGARLVRAGRLIVESTADGTRVLG